MNTLTLLTTVLPTAGAVYAFGSLRVRGLRQALAEAQHEAMHDALTGLANRRGFMAGVAGAVARGGKPAVVALIDLDGFKPINDTHGHAVGDLVLRELGRRWKALISDDGVVARLGGDEFAAYVQLLDGETVDDLRHALTAVTDAPVDLDDLQLPVTVSVGVVGVPTAGGALADLLHEADVEMYGAKVGLTKVAPVSARPPVRVRPTVRLRNLHGLGRSLFGQGVRAA